MEPKNCAFYSNNKVIEHGFSWSNEQKKVLSLSKYLKIFLRQSVAYKSKYILKPLWSQKFAFFTPITKSMNMDLVGQMSKKSTKFVKVLKVTFETISRIQIKVYTQTCMEPKNCAF